MKYFVYALEFLTVNCWYVFGVAALALIVFFLVNACKDVYRSDNKQLCVAIKELGRSDKDFSRFATALPLIYQYQWLSYTKTKKMYPHDVFKFAKKKQKLSWAVPAVLCTALALSLSAYTVARATYDKTLIYVPLVLALLFGLMRGGVNACFCAKTKRANKIFDKLMCYMDAFFGKDYTPSENKILLDEQADELIKKIMFLKENGVNGQSAQKIATLLTQDKLDMARTVTQQKELNKALNGLVQVIAGNNDDQTVQQQQQTN